MGIWGSLGGVLVKGFGVPWGEIVADLLCWSARDSGTCEAHVQKILMVGWCHCWQGSGILGWSWSEVLCTVKQSLGGADQGQGAREGGG